MTIPFVRQFDFTWGKPDRLSSLVERVICNNPGPFTFTGSGTYLIGTRTLAVIDPGPEDEPHLQAILDAVRGRPVSHILLTHTHRDHSAGAPALSRATGAPVLAFAAHPSEPGNAPPALDEGGDFDLVPDRLLADGDRVSGEDWTLEALHTPGHIANHLCFSLAREKALFTGDHVMGWATTVVAPPDGSMADYMDSLDRLLARSDAIYYPTHGAPIHDPLAFVAAIKAHRLERDRQIQASLDNGNNALMDIVADVYRDVDPALHIAAALNVRAHLDCHVAAGRIVSHGSRLEDLHYRRP